MTFPDAIERTVELAKPPEAVWAAITTAEGLSAWFGDEAQIELRPGGAFRMTWNDGADEADMLVERVEAPRVFGYTWPVHGLPDEDPRRTYVEFTLEPNGAGTTLTVRESGFAQLDGEQHQYAWGGNVDGWKHELGELVDYLNAA